jgi:hypothetical protein
MLSAAARINAVGGGPAPSFIDIIQLFKPPSHVAGHARAGPGSGTRHPRWRYSTVGAVALHG